MLRFAWFLQIEISAFVRHRGADASSGAVVSFLCPLCAPYETSAAA